MPALSIFLDANGMLNDIPEKKIIHITEPIKVGALLAGMSSGKASIAFGITLPNGQVVLAETSMRLFHIAAKAFAVRYGWQDDETIAEGNNRQ
jgi:hypothetical protein